MKTSFQEPPLPFTLALSATGEGATLEFPGGRDLQAIHAGDPALLRRLESDLGVRVTSRDGWIRLEGSPEAVSHAVASLTSLGRVMASGGTVTRDQFLYAIRRPSGDPVLEDLHSGRVICSPRKPAVVPKNASQLAYLRLIDSRDITFGIGPAGTGKTYLAVAKAVAALKGEKVDRIVLTRPAVEAGEALGFLPGELEEKILPYLRPLYDALRDMLEPEEIQRAIDRGVIEIAPLAYMRGRTLNRSFVILDEAQNTTSEQMFMFLTRIGVGSRCVITGDPTQTDLPRNKPGGLPEAMEALGAVEGIAIHRFGEGDVVRHPLVRAIVSAYRKHRGVDETPR